MSLHDIRECWENRCEIREGVLYRDGKALHEKSSAGTLKVTIVAPDVFGARPFQGLLTDVKQSPLGFVLTLRERQVILEEGKYYEEELCNTTLELSTRCLGPEFLHVGWAKQQGNTAGIASAPSVC